MLYKGVSVGRVNSVHYDAEAQESVVTFTLDDEQLGPIYKDATLQIGERSLLGDAYLEPRSTSAPPNTGELKAGDEVPHTLNSVDFDEALDFLDKQGRYHAAFADPHDRRAAPPARTTASSSTAPSAASRGPSISCTC